MFIPAESTPLIPILPNSRVGLLVCTLSHGELVGKTIARWWAGWRACSKEQEGAGPSHGHTYYSIFLAEDSSVIKWRNLLKKSPVK